ncbi:dihydrodipicolinate synthase family protein [Fulvimarina sp. MAC8]|uniref:dihydrodipicolinate synthase family protein n=1 Tax=Fulvimarina sp. MAC8 TaxID=3162874 RepID=UPI0032EB6809
MTASSPFHGLSAFPITPADGEGRVDTELLGRLLERICASGADSIGLLGSTGTYAYLSRAERKRAVDAAVECVGGRLPVIVGVGALRTDEAQALSRDAEAVGADALLMAPVSYTPLTEEEAYQHYRTVAGSTGLDLCIYDNPSTTHFSFSNDLVKRLSKVDRIVAVKRPPAVDGDFDGEIAALRSRTGLSIGYSADWTIVPAFLADADAFYSVIGGTMPDLAVRLAAAARSGQTEQARRLDAACAPLWDVFKAYGSLRVMYVLLDILGLGEADLPRPLLPLGFPERRRIEKALEALPA